MRPARACGRRSSPRRRRAQLAADVVVGEPLGQDLRHPPAHERAGAHVARLLLHPDHLLEVRIAVHQLRQLDLGERVEQLHPRDRDVRRGRALLVHRDVVVDLARAEHQLGDLLAAAGQRRVVDHALEAALGELGERRGRGGQPQQALGRHHDQRARLRHQRLAAQQVEVLRRRGAVGHADVALRRHLQEALEPRARVLGARALVAVRQQQREP